MDRIEKIRLELKTGKFNLTKVCNYTGLPMHKKEDINNEKYINNFYIRQ